MASKRSKATPTNDDELDELFEGITDDTAIKKTAKPKPSAAKGKADAAEQDILAELENQLGEKAPSRPHTPRIREVAPKPSPAKRTSTNTPPPDVASGTNAGAAAAARKSAESTRSYHASFTPSATSSDLQESERKAPVDQVQPASTGGGGSGWWGGLLSTATAAMKTAEAAVKEMQQNEEAKKWAEQVRGNVGALRGLGDELRHRAIPTFTNILHTLAPPISSHERLLIHITHDLVGYPSLDPLIHGVFSRVMAQVEGGDLLVIQRGHESSVRSPGGSSEKPSSAFFSGAAGAQSTAGWHDGPWWRATDVPRDLGLIKGLIEGTKLCRANADGYASEFLNAHGGIDQARQRAVEPLSESNPVRRSDLFLSVQAITVDADKALFAGTTAAEKEKESSAVMEEEDAADEQVCFAVYVLDPVHDIQYATVSQSIPAKWIRWLNAPAATGGPLTPASGDESSLDFASSEYERVPEEIREIVEGGGVDPREWVAEWVEEVLTLSVGIVAQRYVARRMGVGEGGLGKGKQKIESILEQGGGEAARAGVL
ncbi:maintenance of telomere capping protein 1 [Apodospora peruviana]|uniref:Maintenance of telomere capping protein 1 n=1 Tax=Apodospora peruviana TaxID=516989 RepID=A0AAE0IQF9_9PEZI|nr:maintenance of telomere capping protein 1 [Apodospora peruviana]